ncbi:MAG TPA: hypothetical protein PKC30_04090 [Saprospiraceae bacterium]|nr:hypothetical protein [Saprospiraceae bacterium]
MKNVILILFMICFSFSLTAGLYPILQVEKEKVFTLDLNDWSNDLLNISILDQKGQVLFQEEYRADGLQIRKYNIKNFPLGMYTLVVEDLLKSISFDLFVSYHNVSVVGKESIHFKPVLKFAKDLLDINLLALNKDIELSVYDSGGVLIYQDHVSDLPVYNKRLNLHQMKSGRFDVVIEVDGKMYTEKFVK